MRRIGCTLVVVALAAGVAAGEAGAAFSGQNGRIAFTTHTHDGNQNIYSIEPDGSGLSRLTADPGSDSHAAWSPSGRRIAFASNRAHPEASCEGLNPACDYDIYVMNADGSRVTRLTDTPGSDRQPYWSPDGRRIVFASSRGGTKGDLFVMNADGRRQTRITSDPGVETAPSWSPDGSRILFSHAPCEFNCGPRHLFTVAADGSGLSQLTAEPASDYSGDWAPDGARIVFQREQFSNAFWTMNADGSGQTRLPGLHQDPAWSPDGTKLAFGGGGVGHMGTDGGFPVTLTLGSAPDWQPRVGPRREDYANGRAFCRAERDFLGGQEFRAVYGNPNRCASAQS